NWYRTAAVLADRSGDLSLRSFVRGRSLARGLYEGYTVKQTLDGVDEVLSLTNTPNNGALEAHAARVCLYALTGNAREGRKAVDDMRAVVDRLPDNEVRAVAGPVERAILHRAYLECRVGSLGEAQAACDDAFSALTDWPLWLAETRLYLARAMIVDGDTSGGISYGLSTMRAIKHDVQVIAIAARDAVSVVPDGYRSDELDALRAYADPKPGP